MKTLSGISLQPRIDTDLCYIYDGANVSTQIAFDGKMWKLFEYDKTTHKQIELGSLETSNMPNTNQYWKLHETTSQKEVLVVQPWKRVDWEKKQKKLIEDGDAKMDDYKEKLAAAEDRLEKLKEASAYETSELRLTVKET